MNKVSKVAAVTAVSGMVAMASIAPALADSPGQLGGGSGVYVVKNVTQNGSYGSSASVNKCEEVKFSIRLHNTEFGSLNNINVKATLPASGSSIVSHMTATPDSGGTTGTSGSVTLNMTSDQNIAYEAGSTQLFDSNGNLIKNLPDGITQNGVNAGTLKGSTTEFVNFKAKVNCPNPPVTPPSTPETPQQPLPQTGAETGLAGMAGTGILGYAVMQYRRSRKVLAEKLLNRK